MQAKIDIKDKVLAERIRYFKDGRYPHLSLTKLFVHALVELMKKEGAE